MNINIINEKPQRSMNHLSVGDFFTIKKDPNHYMFIASEGERFILNLDTYSITEYEEFESENKNNLLEIYKGVLNLTIKEI